MTEWIISSCGLILVVLGLRAVLKDRISQRLCSCGFSDNNTTEAERAYLLDQFGWI